MAGLICSATIEDNAIAATTEETILMILAPANQRVKVREITVGFNGDSNTEIPAHVRFYKPSDAGTASGGTEVVNSPGGASETPQVAATHTFTAEPTVGNALKNIKVHPQVGLIYPVPQSDPIELAGGERFAVAVYAEDAHNVSCTIVWEE